MVIYIPSDGVNWTFQSEELAGYAGQSPVVTIVDGTWYLFYEQLVSYSRSLRYGTSTDGINFTDQGVIYQDPETDGTQGATVCDSIIQDPGGTWHMWYHLGGLSTDTDPHKITSDTLDGGGSWTKASGEFFGTSNWESTYPVVHDGTLYYYVCDQDGDRQYDVHTVNI